MNNLDDVSACDIGKVALFGTYVPKQCGIATFTKDLRDAVTEKLPDNGSIVLAIDDERERLHYPDDVRFQVRVQQQPDYRVAADLLNINQVDVTMIQHEFGIYGGQDGRYVVDLMKRLRMPIICTLHTILRDPTKGQERVMRDMMEYCDRFVAMSYLGVDILKDRYEIPEEKIAYIPHGIPDVPFVDPSFYKDSFGFEGKTVILTFGLLSPAKGIESMLNAMPAIVEKHPEVVYVVLGATHPSILHKESDAYRNSLEHFVEQHGLQDHVVFHNRYVSLEELCRYIGAADIYVTPYLNEAQITSGTLAYAMGMGKAVVSTPYWYAEEMLADNRGRLFPFRDHEALAEQILDLLEHPAEWNALRKNAYRYCRSMVWDAVADAYLEVAQEVIAERRKTPKQVDQAPAEVVSGRAIPNINLKHLRTMTDDTGMYQHAIYTIPDRNHGYCLDDNARALIVALRYNALRKDESVLPLVNTYLAFVHSAFNKDLGRFRNFMGYDRRWLEEQGSEDSHARTIWALGEAVSLATNDGVLGYSTRLFNYAVPAVEDFRSPRSIAFALIGIHAYLRRYGGDTHIRRMREILANNLFVMFEENATDEWPWCEDIVTYDNARLCHALILCGQWIPHQEMVTQGLRSLQWLLDVQTNEKGQISLIGCDGWLKRDGFRALFDQQPVEIMSLVDACAEAYRVTNDKHWGDEIRRCLDWFLGSNDVGEVLYDFKTGGCRDGLSPQGANQNEGAESTLAWLLSLITAYELMAGWQKDPD